ncbi:DmpA family aminopeptidase [Microvirga lotononidis]|uniref:L-aminopeptidase/D-esterase n=1 Tax=Microvirga lotononidis TaxID=864069 RepID=I4YL13_9HYPH|nr:P1 family peptidase [Microvirga lotononidis]EIM24655.1 L-aminopeptidase/D-esterase [Microvirga lotononidis]WQO26669.1 P1 family peptidase [Microvirga lotononidis]
MSAAPRARDLGFACGNLPAGALNSIADVPGVLVGHRTLIDGDIRTGVTAIVPHGGNLYREKPIAAVHVLNGFGKSAGLVQVEELGTLETPILLTNTLSVGTCCTALVRHAIEQNPDIGRETATVNPVVFECNDGYLNDIQALAVTEAHARAALANASSQFAVGSVGAGCGMSTFGFKGGIGTSSRRLDLDGRHYHLGVLVLSNFGRSGDLRLPDGRSVSPSTLDGRSTEKGSIIIVAATDIPLSDRQIKRVIRRSGVGLARLGSFWGHGSGDIALGFTTANILSHDEKAALVGLHVLNEDRIDLLFEAMADATQEAVLDALLAAGSMTGRSGHQRPGLFDTLKSLSPEA